uniref:Retrovirus-related Pol polyprotein from transposon TNT 1-94 n=1 Tax=Tanacetum cinerariifolium TaxID=118510 RepID=A0A699HXB2_TANCI|nr:retrovirus-related Pol polyprotein from transposon TNT 1-94 [Tanacetum cinerariifolium]
MVIKSLKERIKSLSGNMKKDKVKKELEEIKTINIELDHRVTKVIAENEPLKQTYKQLYDSINNQEKVLVITSLKDDLRKLKGKAIVDDVVPSHPIDPELLKVDVAPLAPKLQNNRTVHSDYLRHTQEETATLKEIVEQGTLLNPLNTSLDFACCPNCSLVFRLDCSKHMTGDCSWLTNFVNKFLGMVKFGNDHVAKIMGYGDYQIRNVTISRVYFVEGLGHNLFSVRQLYDSDLKQNGVVERRNQTLIEAACTMLIYAKAPLFLWAEVVTTVCYTQNRSIVRLRHRKTPYELLHKKLPDLSFFHVFGALCYPTNDSENLGKLQPKANVGIFIGYALIKKAFWIYNRRTRRIIKTIHVDFDELTSMASEHNSSGPALHEMTPATISLGLMPNPSSSTSFVSISHETSVARSPQQNSVVERRNRTLLEAACTISGVMLNPPSSTAFVPPSRTDWDILFQSLFDELLTPPPSVDHPAPKVIALIPKVVAPEPTASTGSTSSTKINQDTPSPSNYQSTPETQPPVIPNDVQEDNHDIKVAHMGNDPYFGIPIPKVPFDQPSSSDIIHTIVHRDHQISKHNSKWTRLRLHEQGIFCYYDAFLTSIEPKTYKDALSQYYWIEAMQEELHEFEHLEVWELIPQPDKVMFITLK